MEPLTTGAMTLLIFCGNKFIDWGMGKAFDAAFNKLTEVSPETAQTLALQPGEREDMGEAVLVEMVENTAIKEPELATFLTELGEKVAAKASQNQDLADAFNRLAKQIQAQKPTVINENWQGINIKGGTNTVEGNTLSFGK